jgi:hypothetical protein
MLGSDYFAHFPTVAKKSMVADIDIDGEPMLNPMQDVVVYGEGHSTLDAAAHEAARLLLLVVSPDSYPEGGEFVRQDGYSFVRQRIPTIETDVGILSSNSPARAKENYDHWVHQVYHSPKDDMNQPLDFEAGSKYAKYNFLVAYLVAQTAERPRWYPGDFFGQKYGDKKSP